MHLPLTSLTTALTTVLIAVIAGPVLLLVLNQYCHLVLAQYYTSSTFSVSILLQAQFKNTTAQLSFFFFGTLALVLQKGVNYVQFHPIHF